MGTASKAFTLPVGSYEVQAVYNGDANNNTAKSTCGSEPVTVNPAGPTVTVVAGSVSGTFTVTDSITRNGCPGQCSLPVTEVDALLEVLRGQRTVPPA